MNHSASFCTSSCWIVSALVAMFIPCRESLRECVHSYSKQQPDPSSSVFLKAQLPDS
jgi:hypothetical protein